MDYKKIIANMTLEEKALQLSQVAAADIIQDVDAVVTGISHSGVPQEHLGELGSALNFSGIEAVSYTHLWTIMQILGRERTPARIDGAIAAL